MNAGLHLEQVRAEVTRLLAAGIRSGLMPSSAPHGTPLDKLPDEVKAVATELDAEIERLRQLKEQAVAAQDFQRAAALRDEADKLAKRRRATLADGHDLDR